MDSQHTNTPDDLADYWAEIQECLTDALIDYKESNPELIKLRINRDSD